jgi:hypothetical protein
LGDAPAGEGGQGLAVMVRVVSSGGSFLGQADDFEPEAAEGGGPAAEPGSGDRGELRGGRAESDGPQDDPEE